MSYKTLVQSDSPVIYLDLDDGFNIPSSAVVLITGEGLNGVNVYTNLTGLTVTGSNLATTTSLHTPYPFGRSCINFSNSTSRIYFTTTAVAFGTGDWTVEMWIYPTSVSADRTLADFRYSAPSNQGDGLFYIEATTGKISYWNDTTNYNGNLSQDDVVSLNTWQHIAYTYSSGTLRAFKDGNKIMEHSGLSLDFRAVSNQVKIGIEYDNASNVFVGGMKQIIMHDSAVWTANFTPQSDRAYGDISGSADLGFFPTINNSSTYTNPANFPTVAAGLMGEGNALEFSGYESWLISWAGTEYASHTVGSVELWFKTTETTNADLFTYDNSASTFDNFQIGLYTSSGGSPGRIYVNSSNSSTQNIIETTSEFNDGEVHHLVVQSNGTTTKIWVDGREQTTVVLSGSNNGLWFNDLTYTATCEMTVGARRSSYLAALEFEGFIDDVAVYDYVLSEAQIQSHSDTGPIRCVPAILTVTPQHSYPTVNATHVPLSIREYKAFVNDEYSHIISEAGPVNWWRSDFGNLSYHLSDPFNSDNIDTAKWSILKDFGGDYSIVDPTSNGLRLAFDNNPGGSGTLYNGVKSNVLYTGDFNFEVLFDNLSAYIETGQPFYFSLYGLLIEDGNVRVESYVETTTGSGTRYSGRISGSIVNSTVTPTGPGGLRIERVGTTISTYYKDGVGDWTELRVSTDQPTGPVELSIHVNGSYLIDLTSSLDVTVTDFSGTADGTIVKYISDSLQPPIIDQNLIFTTNGSPDSVDSLVKKGIGAVSYAGIDEYAVLDSPGWRSGDTQGTVEFWLKTAYPLENTEHYFFCTNESIASANYNHFGIIGTKDGKLGIIIYEESGVLPILRLETTDFKFQPSRIYHIAATSNATTTKLYVNGVEQSVKIKAGLNTGQWLSSAVDRDRVSLGCFISSGTSNYNFNGTLDDVAVYDYALTENELFTHYAAGNIMSQHLEIVAPKAWVGLSQYSTKVQEDSPIVYHSLDNLPDYSNDVIRMHTDGSLIEAAQSKSYTNSGTSLVSADGDIFCANDVRFIDNDRIYFAYDVAWNIVADQLGRTFEVWAKLEQYNTASWRTLFSNWTGSTNWRLQVGDQGEIKFETGGTGGFTTSTGIISLNTYYHIRLIIEYTGTGNRAALYVDGDRVGISTVDISYTNTNAVLNWGTNVTSDLGWYGRMTDFNVRYGADNPISNTETVYAYKSRSWSVGEPDGLVFRFRGQGAAIQSNNRSIGKEFLSSGSYTASVLNTGEIRDRIGSAAVVTVESWFETTSIGATQYILFVALDSFTNVPGQAIRISSSGKIEISAKSGNTDPSRTLTSVQTISANIPYHVVGIIDYANDQISLYVNGEHDKTEALDFSNNYYVPVTTTTYDAIGSTAASANKFDGMIDEVAIYDYALTPTQIFEHYTLGTDAVLANMAELSITTYPINSIRIEANTDALAILTGQATIDFEIPSGTIDANTDVLLITSYLASVQNIAHNIDTNLDVLNVTEQPAGIQWSAIFVNTSTDNLIIETQSAFVEKDTIIDASKDTLLFKSAGDVTLGFDRIFNVGFDSLTITELTLDYPVDIETNIDSLTITTQQADPTLPVFINASPYQILINTKISDPDLLFEINGINDELILTEQTAEIYLGIPIDVNQGAAIPLVLTEQPVQLGFDRVLNSSVFPLILTERKVFFAIQIEGSENLTITTYVADPDMTIFVDQGAETQLALTEYQALVSHDITIDVNNTPNLSIGPYSVIVTLPAFKVDVETLPLTLGVYSTNIQLEQVVFDCDFDTLIITTNIAETGLYLNVDASVKNLNIFEKLASIELPIISVNTTPDTLAITTQQSDITNRIEFLIFAQNQPELLFRGKRSTIEQPIDKIYTGNQLITATEYPASIDMPIINIDGNPDVINITGNVQTFSFVNTLILQPIEFVQQNYNIGFEWSADPNTIFKIEEAEFTAIYRKVTFRYELPAGVVGYKIIMAGNTQYELVK